MEGRKEGRKENFPELHFVRASACLMVIILHTAANYFYELGPHWMASNIIDSLVRPCVPLFFMISGALLLRRSAFENYLYFITSRLHKITYPLLFWSSISCFAYVITKHESPLNFFLRLFGTSGFYHLWYLYALIGLYPLMPIIGKWYANVSKSEKIFFLILWFCASSCLPISNFANRLFEKDVDILQLYGIWELASYAGYFVLGAFLFDNESDSIKNRLSTRTCFALFIAAGVFTSVVTYFASQMFYEPCEIFYSYRSPLVITASAAFFMFASKLSFSNKIFYGCVSVVSKYSFGIYCTHAYILYVLQKITGAAVMPLMTNSWITAAVIAVITGCTFAVSLAITMLFKKLPFFRKIV